jgi:rRNA small subunit pseudouridine methyltransferase Nep1
MLTIILAESALEPIPEEIRSHPSVVANAKRRKKRSGLMILDGSLHHSAMKSLEDWSRRGRPDIVHAFLLTSMDSLLNLEGALKVLVHTRNDQLITFDSCVRLPKNYNRFVGLMEQLFDSGSVPAELPEDMERPLIELSDGKALPVVVKNLREEAESAGRDVKLTVMSDAGEAVNAGEFFRDTVRSGDEHICILGGFPEGGFRTELTELAPDRVISIYPEALETWTVASEVLVNYRNVCREHEADEADGRGEQS